jgi:hypothetical protein
MNPIPIGWCLAGAGVAALLGAWGAWTISDWRHDSAALTALNTATADAKKAPKQSRAQGDAYEKDRQDDQVQSTVRESRISTIYRDRPVPADCAVPDDAGSVLDDAIRAANARAAGQPGSGLPAAGSPPVPVP